MSQEFLESPAHFSHGSLASRCTGCSTVCMWVAAIYALMLQTRTGFPSFQPPYMNLVCEELFAKVSRVSNLSLDASSISDGCQVTKGIFWANRMTCCPVPEPSSKANSCRWDWSSSTSSSTEQRLSQFLSAWGDSSMVWRNWGGALRFLCKSTANYSDLCQWIRLAFTFDGSGTLVNSGPGGCLKEQMGAQITWLRGFNLCSSSDKHIHGHNPTHHSKMYVWLG